MARFGTHWNIGGTGPSSGAVRARGALSRGKREFWGKISKYHGVLPERLPNEDAKTLNGFEKAAEKWFLFRDIVFLAVLATCLGHRFLSLIL